MVNSRYGIGRYVTQSNINSDQLILMADHCDQMLGDGVKRGINDVTPTSMEDSDYTFVTGDLGRYICCNSPADATVFTTLLITSLSHYNHCANGSAGWTAGIPPAAYWEFGEKRYELDLVIDSQNPAFDCINQICGSFRAVPMWNKDAIQLLIDKKESPSYIFNMGNIIEGSFSHSFGSEKNKPNCIQVDYADKTRNFQKATVDITDFAAITGGVPKRTRRLSLLGASRQSQIYREARYHLNSPKYQDEQITFKGAIDAIHMLPGDVVKFQHDVFQWGQGGRVVSATTTAITLDQPVTIGAGTYVITCKLADDTLETKTISSGVGTYTTVQCAAFTTPPPVFSLYAFGLTGVEAKPFRIVQIAKTPENEIEVVATEYSDSVYTDTGIILAQPVYSSLPSDPGWPSDPNVLSDPLLAPPDVTGFAVTETVDRTGVYITFTRPATTTNWTKANIYISRDAGTTYEIIGIMYNENPMIYRDVAVGLAYKFKAISLSFFDIPSASPPVVPITIIGIAGIALTNLTATSTFKYIILDWINPTISNVQLIEVWRSDTNDRATAVLIAVIYNDVYWDYIGTTGTTRYYWIRAKSLNGTYSGWLPSSATGGVSATTAQINASDLIDYSVVSSKLADSAVITSKLAPQAVDNTKLKDLAVDAAKLAGSAVTSTKIASAAVGSAAIGLLAVGTAHVADACIQTAKIGDLQVLSGKIGNLAITEGKIGNLAVTSAKIQDLNVDTAKIANLSVLTIKVANQAITRGASYYNAGTYNWSVWDEQEVGTVTVSTNETTDEVWIWAHCDIVQLSIEWDYVQLVTVPVTLYLRRDSIYGPILEYAVTIAITEKVFMVSDTPGGTPGDHVYKLTAQGAGGSIQSVAGVANRRIMALAKSR